MAVLGNYTSEELDAVPEEVHSRGQKMFLTKKITFKVHLILNSA
jgi:hypothetical protein